jgi:hypothetical protein
MQVEDFRFIDAHTHFFPQPMFEAIWRHFQSRADQELFEIIFQWEEERLVAYLEAMGVERFFALIYSHRPNISLDLNRWLAEFVGRHPQAVPFGSLHAGDDNLVDVIETSVREYGITGFKVHPLVQRIPPDDERLFPAYERLIELGRPVIFHTGSAHGYDDPSAAHHLEAVLRRYPTLHCVTAHLGMFEFDLFMDLMEEYPTIWADVTTVFANTRGYRYTAEVNRLLCLQDRLMWGTDFPNTFLPPKQVAANLIALSLGGEFYKKVFYGNAARFLTQFAPSNIHNPSPQRSAFDGR